MEAYEKRSLRWQRLTALFMAAIFILLLWAAVGISKLAKGVERYGESADVIISRMEDFTAQLEALDLEGLTVTLTALSEDLEDADIAGLTASIQDMLNSVDWRALSENLNTVAGDAQESLLLCEEALQKAIEAIDKLDIETLNDAITDLRSVVEPLANFVDKFK